MDGMRWFSAGRMGRNHRVLQCRTDPYFGMSMRCCNAVRCFTEYVTATGLL
jgi:hypothetical protein